VRIGTSLKRTRFVTFRAFSPYSPECVEGEFSELRLKGVLGSQVCGASRKLGGAMQDGVGIIGRRYR
jgi:hypothetical protein